MSDVVLRCPTCGTTQSHPGECDSCYGGQVRYFCSNHSPGLWLDEPVCKECGVKFGEAPTRRPTPRPPAAPPVRTRKTRRPESRPAMRGAEPPRASPRRLPEAEITPSEPSLEDLLGRISSGTRERTRYEEEEAPWAEPAPEVRLSRPRLKGCLVTFLVLALLFLALTLVGSFLLVGGAVKYFLGDLSQPTRLMSGIPEQTARGMSWYQALASRPVDLPLYIKMPQLPARRMAEEGSHEVE